MSNFYESKVGTEALSKEEIVNIIKNIIKNRKYDKRAYRFVNDYYFKSSVDLKTADEDSLYTIWRILTKEFPDCTKLWRDFENRRGMYAFEGYHISVVVPVALLLFYYLDSTATIGFGFCDDNEGLSSSDVFWIVSQLNPEGIYFNNETDFSEYRKRLKEKGLL